MKINIRFLKQGLLEIDVPDNSTIEEIELLGRDAIDASSDQDLNMAMSDVVPSGPNPTRYDRDNFVVEAIEDSEFNLLYFTELWNEYAYPSNQEGI